METILTPDLESSGSETLTSTDIAKFNYAPFKQKRVAVSVARLMNAAVELLSERGYARISLAAIGDRAGYSRALVTRRFGSKERFMQAIVAEFARAWVKLYAALRNEPSDSDGLRFIIDAISHQNRSNFVFTRGSLRLVFESVANPDVLYATWCRTLLEEFRQTYVFAIERGMNAGIYRRDIDAARIASLIEFIIRGQAYHLLLEEAFDFDGALSILDETLDQLVRVRPAETSWTQNTKLSKLREKSAGTT